MRARPREGNVNQGPVPRSCLSALLGRGARARFLTEHWQRRTYRSRLAFAPELRSALALNVLSFKKAALIAEHGTLRAYGRSARGVPQEVIVRHEQIDDLFWAGMGIVIFDFQKFHPPLLAVMRAMRSELGFDGNLSATAILSPPGATTALHFDEVSVFNLQLQGTKTWYYGDEPAVSDPPIAVKIDVVEALRVSHPWIPPVPKVKHLRRAIQAPGGILYHAPGTWHEVTSNEISLSVALNFHPTSRARALTDRLYELLNGHEGWRTERGPSERSAPRSRAGRPESAEDSVLALAAKLEAKLAQERPAPVAAEEPQDAVVSARLPGRGDVYEVIHPFKFAATKGTGDDLEVTTSARGFSLGSEALALLEKLAATDTFSAGELMRWPSHQRMITSWAEARTLISDLVGLGLIQRVRA